MTGELSRETRCARAGVQKLSLTKTVNEMPMYLAPRVNQVEALRNE